MGASGVSLAEMVLVGVSFLAGAQNALAGGGMFLVFPALLYMGLDPRLANITLTIALFPSQVTTSLAGRRLVAGAAGISVRNLVAISLLGGALGAVLLLATPVGIFTHLVPYLVLFATMVFAWGSFFGARRANGAPALISPRMAMLAQMGIAVYGGYFGGGIGFLMLAALTSAGLALRHAGATKNLLAGVMNVAAVMIFMLCARVDWRLVLLVALAAAAGGQFGVYLLRRMNETVLRVGVIAIGLMLTVGLFMRA